MMDILFEVIEWGKEKAFSAYSLLGEVWEGFLDLLASLPQIELPQLPEVIVIEKEVAPKEETFPPFPL
jgi:hypothetical protein